MKLRKRAPVWVVLAFVPLASRCLNPQGTHTLPNESVRPLPLPEPRGATPQRIERGQILPPLINIQEEEAPAPIVEVGIASWYGDDHRGRRMANGKRFDKTALTAAHKTLPLNTIVKVRNLDTQREVVVRITDRGPYIRGRIIDLTEYAARRVGMIRAGIAPVEVEVLQLP